MVVQGAGKEIIGEASKLWAITLWGEVLAIVVAQGSTTCWPWP